MLDIFRISRGARFLISIMMGVVIIGITIAWLYYRGKNLSRDPRVTAANKMLVEYDALIKEKEYMKVFPLLDSIENVYLKTPGYDSSFEMGVVYNNRAATLLLMALYETDDEEEKERLLSMSKENNIAAIAIYESWINRMEDKTDNEIKQIIKPGFSIDDEAFQDRDISKILDARVQEIKDAQIETKRRLSVSYTNLGIIQRHQLQQEEALKSYEQALLLWKENHTARNNLNVLLGRPTEDRTILEKLFPPERLKE